MAAPIIRLPRERVAHSLGVPLEFIRMDGDVLGLGDFYAPDIAPTGSTGIPPELMSHDAGDQTRRWNGRVSGGPRLMPPEFGMAPIPEVVSNQPLLPTGANDKSSPVTNHVKKINITDARSEFVDTYPAQAEVGGDPMFMSDAMDPSDGPGDDLTLLEGMGEGESFVTTGAKILQGFMTGATADARAQQDLNAKALGLQAQLEQQAHDERMKVLGIVGIGALAIGAVVAFSYLRRR